MTRRMKEVRGAWLLGCWTGVHACLAWTLRDWTWLVPAVIGLYGLLDVEAMNSKLKRDAR